MHSGFCLFMAPSILPDIALVQNVRIDRAHSSLRILSTSARQPGLTHEAIDRCADRPRGATEATYEGFSNRFHPQSLWRSHLALAPAGIWQDSWFALLAAARLRGI